MKRAGGQSPRSSPAGDALLKAQQQFLATAATSPIGQSNARNAPGSTPNGKTTLHNPSPFVSALLEATNDGFGSGPNIGASPSENFTQSGISPEFPHRLSLYCTLPDFFNLEMDALEAAAVARLSILRAIDGAMMRGTKDDEICSLVRALEDRHGVHLHSNVVARSFPVEEERRLDCAAHWLLQMAFADSLALGMSGGDGRRWFVQQECALLKGRWMAVPDWQWLEEELSGYERLSAEERRRLQETLSKYCPHVPNPLYETFYKVRLLLGVFRCHSIMSPICFFERLCMFRGASPTFPGRTPFLPF